MPDELMTRQEAIDCAKHAFFSGFAEACGKTYQGDLSWIEDMIDEVRQHHNTRPGGSDDNKK